MNIEILLKINEKKLFARAYILTRHEDDAYDLLQMSMEKIFKSHQMLDNESNFLPWAYTIMRNTFIDNYRSKQKLPDQISIDSFDDRNEDREKIHIDELSSLREIKTPEDSFVINEKYSFTMNLIKQMKPIHRDIINMHMTGFKYEEIAKELGMKIGSVMSTLSRIREKISIEWQLFLNEEKN